MVKFSYSLSDINSIAQQLINTASAKRIWLLQGDLGAGKTTLVKAICRQLGAVGDFSSPTYSLVNEYLLPSGGAVYHIDLYRLNSIEEALDIGVEEYLNSGSYCLIEWPQLILPLLHQEEFWMLEIETVGKEERLIREVNPS